MSANEGRSEAFRPRERLDGIDLLRGAACLLVVIYHLGMYVLGALYVGWDSVAAQLPTTARWLLVVPRMGYLGVSLFLVLSGFCLAWPYVGPRSDAAVDTRAFLLARALRILPPYYASLLVLWGAVSVGGPLARATFQPVEAWDVGVHALLLHNLSPRTLWSLNGAYWSLALEAQLYLAFLVVLPAFRRHPARTFFAALLFSALVPPLLARLLQSPATGPGWAVVHESLAAHLFELVCGVLAAQLVAARAAISKWLLCALAPLWLPTGFAATVWHVWPSPLDKIVYGFSFGALVLLVARVDLGAGRLARVLRVPGTASYSLYLLHQPLILVLAPWIWKLGLPAPRLWLAALFVGLPALVVLGYLAHLVVERPFLRGGIARRWLVRESSGGNTRNDDGAVRETSS